MTVREVCEFRIPERYAPLLFGENEGTRLGDSVRKVQLSTTDPRYAKIGELQEEIIRKERKAFFYGWSISRRYSAPELAAAKAFQLLVVGRFEPAGEQCGTAYDEGVACIHCGAGAKQNGPLFLDIKKIPKNRDFAMTIAGEIVVSERVRRMLHDHSVEGVDLFPVRFKEAKTLEPTNWFQLSPRKFEADIAPPTRIGNDPFDDDPLGEYRCDPHLMGLNQLSEVSVALNGNAEFDIVATKQFVGVRRGLLRPASIIVVSARVRNLLTLAKLKGCKFEVVHVVD